MREEERILEKSHKAEVGKGWETLAYILGFIVFNVIFPVNFLTMTLPCLALSLLTPISRKSLENMPQFFKICSEIEIKWKSAYAQSNKWFKLQGIIFVLLKF